MNHKIMASVLIPLGIVELAAGYFKIRYWIFLRAKGGLQKNLAKMLCSDAERLQALLELF